MRSQSLNSLTEGELRNYESQMLGDFSVIVVSTCSPQWRHKFNNLNLFKEHLTMKTILAIDLGKRNSVFCRLESGSLKPEYFKAKTDAQKFHNIFAELEGSNSIVLFEVGSQAGWLCVMIGLSTYTNVFHEATSNAGR